MKITNGKGYNISMVKFFYDILEFHETDYVFSGEGAAAIWGFGFGGPELTYNFKNGTYNKRYDLLKELGKGIEIIIHKDNFSWEGVIEILHEGRRFKIFEPERILVESIASHPNLDAYFFVEALKKVKQMKFDEKKIKHYTTMYNAEEKMKYVGLI